MTNYRNVTNCSRYAIKVDGCKCIPNIVAYGMQCTFCYKHKEKLVRFKWILWDVENPTNEELENVTWHVKSLFNNKERKKSMITDKQGGEWLLQKLYDDGWRYIVGGDGTFVYITKSKPFILDGMYRANGDKYRCIELIRGTLPSLETCDVMDIAGELGIVDWSKVAVDTPILVKDDYDDKWEKAYFAKYEEEMIYAWNNGRTSFSARNKDDTFIWDRAKLAEV